ncbi:hypothetical protein BJ165DRAFT_1562864, partial [Panaeolus papilionaceus]
PASPVNNVLLKLFFYNDSNASPLHLTPIHVIGAAMVLTGILILLSCYRAFGEFFSIRIGIQRDHKLVTKFPCLIVHHPSFAAWLYLSLGHCTRISHLGRGLLSQALRTLG